MSYLIFLLITFLINSSIEDSNKLHQNKIKKLSSCMRLTKQRQVKDKDFFDSLLKYVDTIYALQISNGDENKIGPNDFLAYVIVTCYSKITNSQSYSILNTKDVNVFTKENKDLLDLEFSYSLYETNSHEVIEERLVNLQEQLVEVIRLSKEAEILEQKDFNILDNNKNILIGLSYIDILYAYLYDFRFDFSNILVLVLGFIIIIYLFWILLLRKNENEENTRQINTNSQSQEKVYKKKEKNKNKKEKKN